MLLSIYRSIVCTIREIDVSKHWVGIPLGCALTSPGRAERRLEGAKPQSGPPGTGPSRRGLDAQPSSGAPRIRRRTPTKTTSTNRFRRSATHSPAAYFKSLVCFGLVCYWFRRNFPPPAQVLANHNNNITTTIQQATTKLDRCKLFFWLDERTTSAWQVGTTRYSHAAQLGRLEWTSCMPWHSPLYPPLWRHREALSTGPLGPPT